MTIINRPVTGATRTMKRIVPLLGFAVALLALPAYAELVGLYTFDGADPLDAVIGVPAYEGVCPENKKPPVLSDILQTITLVTEGLDDRCSVLLPRQCGLALLFPVQPVE